MNFLRANAHVVWMIPFIAGIAIRYRSFALFITLMALECVSLGLHQYVHHQRRYFGDPHVLVGLGILTLVLSFFLLP